MASDTKTPVEVARELTKALGEKIDELMKMDLPQSPEKAIGGQESSGSVPSMPKQAGGTTDAEQDAGGMQGGTPGNLAEMNKDEIVAVSKAKCPSCGKESSKSHQSESGRKIVPACDRCKKRNVGNVQKMDLPHSSEKASGGQIKKDEKPAAEKPKFSNCKGCDEGKVIASAHTCIAQGTNKSEMKKSEFSASDVAEALTKTLAEKIDAMRTELVKMEKLEAAANASLQKNIGALPSSTPSTKQIADGDPNKMVGQRNIFTLMHKGEGKYTPWDKSAKKSKPKPGKEVSAGEGSGGSDTTKKGPLASKLSKEAMGMPAMPKAPSLKPSGVPGAKAGSAPKAPKTPQAPGAKPSETVKMELPHSSQKANGGQEKSGSVPSVSKQAGGTTDAEVNKMDLPQSSEKAIGGQEKSGSVPSVSKQAGGTTDAETMAKQVMAPGAPAPVAGKPIHPSPVFANRMNISARHEMKVGPSGAMTAHRPNGDVFGASGYQIAQAIPKQKTPGAMSVGSNTASDITVPDAKTVNVRPPFTKSELDGAKCPGCKQGMTLCKCK